MHADKDEVSKLKEPLIAIPEDGVEHSSEEETVTGIKKLKEGEQKMEDEEGVLGKVPTTKDPSFQDTAASTVKVMSDTTAEEEISSLKEDLMRKKYKVWRPQRQPHLSNLLKNAKKSPEKRREKSLAAVPPLDLSASKMSFFMRQQQLLNRVQATQAVLMEATDEILSPSPTPKKPHMSFKEACQRVISQRRLTTGHGSLSDVVTQYQARIKREGESLPASQSPRTPISARFPPKRRFSKQSSILGAIPLHKWYELVVEEPGYEGKGDDKEEK